MLFRGVNSHEAADGNGKLAMAKRRKHLRPRVIVRDGLICGICGKDCAAPVDNGWTTTRKDGAHVDHVLPLWVGGRDAIRNARVLCETCHKEKTKKEAALRRTVRRKAAKAKAHRRAMQAKGKA